MIPLVLVALVAIGNAAGGGKSTTKAASSSPSSPTTAKPAVAAKTAKTTTTPAPTTTAAPLFPGRPDAQSKDQERNIGASAMLGGYTATVTSATWKQDLDVVSTDGYILANVSVINRNSDSQSYSDSDWRVQTPSGSVVDSTIDTNSGALNSGDLIKGGTASGEIAFDVGSAKGNYYLLYKPKALDASRGVWRITH